MNLKELKDLGYHRLVIKETIKSNVKGTNTQPTYPREKYRTSPIFCQESKRAVPRHEYVNTKIKACGGKNAKLLFELIDIDCYLASRICPKLYDMHKARFVKINSGEWGRCIWHGELPRTAFEDLHLAHVSETDPTQVAFTPDEGKLLRNVQTRMKPGRYLMKFYGPESENPVLTEAQCKQWADRWAASLLPVELKFIPNTDPDGWEWVYENSPPSCMRYNRSGRHLDYSAREEDHPVRCYAHPGNNLALAYILKAGVIEDRDENCGSDAYVVTARTIVNTDRRTWLRTYAEDDRERSKLVELLKAEGYSQSDETLRSQKLVRRELGSSLLCPYLDGDYTNVADHGDYLKIGSSGHDGQNSDGLIAERSYCDSCGAACDEDDLTYVECDEREVCQSCLEEDYVYAYVNRYDREHIRTDDAIEVDGEYYSEGGAEYHSIYQCAECDEWCHEDDMVTLEDGDMVCDKHAAQCAVTEEWHLRSELVETEFDGRIYEGYAVQLWPSGELGWKEKCYVLSTTHGELYVHENVLGSAELATHFVQFGELLLPTRYEGHEFFGKPVEQGFVPNNVVGGSETVDVTDLIDEWGAEPTPDSNNLEQREALAA